MNRYMRCNGPGWIELACPDGRRGLWARVTDKGIELCAGREGDDAYVSLPWETIDDLASVLGYAKGGFDMAKINEGNKAGT